MTEDMTGIGCRELGAVSTYEVVTFDPRPEGEVGESQSGWDMCKSLKVAKNLVCASSQGERGREWEWSKCEEEAEEWRDRN